MAQSPKGMFVLNEPGLKRCTRGFSHRSEVLFSCRRTINSRLLDRSNNFRIQQRARLLDFTNDSCER